MTKTMDIPPQGIERKIGEYTVKAFYVSGAGYKIEARDGDGFYLHEAASLHTFSTTACKRFDELCDSLAADIAADQERLAVPTTPTLTAQQCADELRPWVRQMPGGGSQFLDQLLAHATPNTPAEARTGSSDRTAAALNDVAKARKHVLSPIGDLAEVLACLDRIEAVLRGRS